MVAREHVTGLRTSTNPGGLVLPLVVRDGRHFAPWLERVQCLRFEQLTDVPAFRNSSAYVDEFLPVVRRLCDAVEDAMANVPAFAAFPEREPETALHDTPLSLPRFGSVKVKP